MHFEQLSTLVRSLRFRLTAWNTAVVLLTVVVTLLGVREGLRLTLLAEFDKLLLDDTREVASAIEQSYPSLDRIISDIKLKENSHTDRKLFVQLLDADQRLLYAGASDRPTDLDSLEAPTVEAKLQTIGEHRWAQRTLDFAGIPAYTVRVGSPLESVYEDVWTATYLMIIAGAVIVFVAPVGGYWLARRATSPLARIITTAKRLRPSYLEERLPTQGTGDELDQLSLTINRFLDLIADHLDHNREFVANAAHELRSPLAAIQSSVEVTLNSDRTTAEYQDLLYEIADQCAHLGVLVNQLLLLAETDAARLDIKRSPVRLDRLVEKSIDMFRGAAEERGINLSAEQLPNVTLEADGNRLRQVVNNLIDNSLKFTPRGGDVRIRIEPEGENGHVVIEVADTGIGISSDDLPHVFERFYRGDKSRRREHATRGNGLGLSICQSIVAAHGGEIRVQSASGNGAVFTVSLPQAAGHAASA